MARFRQGWLIVVAVLVGWATVASTMAVRMDIQAGKVLENLRDLATAHTARLQKPNAGEQKQDHPEEIQPPPLPCKPP